MAGIKDDGKGVTEVTLTSEERKALTEHGKRWDVSLVDVLTHIIDDGVNHLYPLGGMSDKIKADRQREEAATVALHVVYPTVGPLSNFSGDEKGFVAGLLIETLNVALSSIMTQRKIERIVDGMERANQGMGSGFTAIPIDGRGLLELLRRWGPDSSEG